MGNGCLMICLFLCNRIKLDNMKKEKNVKKKTYIAPDMLCVELSTVRRILTVSGDINDVPWEE